MHLDQVLKGCQVVTFFITVCRYKTKNKHPDQSDPILDIMSELQEDMKSHRVIISHSDVLDLAKQFGELVKERFGSDLELEYAIVNPTAGSHCGPNAIGISFHAKHR